MGKSLFFKIVALFLTVIMTVVVLENYNKSQTSDNENDSNKKISDLSSTIKKPLEQQKMRYDENKTLDSAYQSVAKQIEAFRDRQQKREYDQTAASIKVLDETVVLYEVNKTVVQKVVKTEKKVVSKIVEKKKEKIVALKSDSIPKLAIIMDDVGFCYQADSIKKLPIPITPSIFPPNEHYPNTVKIAQRFKHHMVHFPMEAYKYKNLKEDAVKVTDSAQKLEKRVAVVKASFPNLIAINNHTGSKFTCDLNAMDRFFKILNKYDISFIDSRTAAETKCVQAAKVYQKKILQRDIFLDNVADVPYIHAQLKAAVKMAKNNGQAIAICHPRDLTFKALMRAKHILKDVKIVYIDELM